METVEIPNEEGADGGGAANDMVEESGEHKLEDERKKMAEEFNTQRARMKELFLQKEEDLRHHLSEKQQLQSEVLSLRAEVQQLQTLSENQKSEIESLQLLIHETVEASSSACSLEVRRLQTRNLELEQQLNYLSKQQASQDAALAPAALVRSIARKLGADTEGEDTKKVGRYAQEGAELLRSLVEPLEEEIKALKVKLRDTDTQLQQQLANNQPSTAKGDTQSGVNAEELPAASRCDMCQNYERQLVSEQARSDEARSRTRDLERSLKMATEELESCRSIQEETEQAWRSDRAQRAQELAALRSEAARCREELARRGREVDEASRRALQRVTALTVQRETLQEYHDTLERDNDMLIGKYAKKARELQSEDINLPDTVQELQEHVLRLCEELIVVSVGREKAVSEHRSARQQLQEAAKTAHDHLKLLHLAGKESQQLRQELESLKADRQQLNELGEKLHQANNSIEELLEDKKRLQNEVIGLRGRVSSLQLDLDNSEKVQQDFVRLSQSLQIQLERIRESETEVRWQFEDDVTECPGCHAHLANNKQKVHCRHCGRIFCSACVSGTVSAGARGRAAHVCAVCYTLLQPLAKPYFSTDPPRPD